MSIISNKPKIFAETNDVLHTTKNTNTGCGGLLYLTPVQSPIILKIYNSWFNSAGMGEQQLYIFRVL